MKLLQNKNNINTYGELRILLTIYTRPEFVLQLTNQSQQKQNPVETLTPKKTCQLSKPLQKQKPLMGVTSVYLCRQHLEGGGVSPVATESGRGPHTTAGRPVCVQATYN